MPPRGRRPAVRARVGDNVQYKYRDGKWYNMKVSDVRHSDEEPRELLLHYRGVTSKREDCWISADSTDLRWPLTGNAAYLAGFAHEAGHLGDERWKVNCILDERPSEAGDGHDYFVSWVGWSSSRP